VAQDEHRVQRIKEYVLARLREELSSAPRGAQAQLAKKLGVSGAHLSNMLSSQPTRQPGEDFRRKAAAHWHISYAQLEAMALGEDSAPPSSAKPIREPDELPAHLHAVIEHYAWMPELPPVLRAIVKAQAAQHHRFGGGDLPADEWQRVVTGLEREALALLARRANSDAPPAPTPSRNPSGFTVRSPKRGSGT
jgi:transcriptional regulator with XRE-family HTH domain